LKKSRKKCPPPPHPRRNSRSLGFAGKDVTSEEEVIAKKARDLVKSHG
jgi:hypothetical protein